MVTRALKRTGEMVRARGVMYRAVEQSVIFYGRKIWVVTGDMLKVLEGFHHREAQRITGMTVKPGEGGEGEYLSVVEALEAAGLHPIGVYIRRQQATIAKRVACRPID